MSKNFHILGLVTGSVIAVLGIWVQFNPPARLLDPPYIKHVFGITLIVYGIFRAYRAYIGYKNA